MARFRAAYPEIKRLGGELVGISTDTHARQCAFAEDSGAPFPMIGDEDRSISGKFGVVWPLLGVDRRVTVYVDETGLVRGVFQHEIQVTRHVDDALEMLRARSRSRAE